MKEELTPEEKKKKRNASIASIIGVCATIIATALFTQIQNNNRLDKELLKEVQNGNSLCPIVIDEFARIDSLSTPKSKTIMQHITAINTIKEDVNLDTVRKYIEPELLKNARNNPLLKSARKNKITIIYSFNDMNGNVFYEYIITPDMYK